MRDPGRNLSLLALALWAFLGIAHAQDTRIPDLPLGDPELRERSVPVVLDAVVEVRTGAVLTPGELAARLAGARVVLAGESHTSAAAHAVQLRVIRALHDAGREVHVGLEMLPRSQQVHLDRWVDGLYTERGFVELADWYGNWGYHWGYYRDVLLFARDHGLRVHALNTRRSLVSAVGASGVAGLSEEDAADLPPLALDSPDGDDHRRLFRAHFEGGDDEIHDPEDEARWERMFEAQVTWDAAMADGALRALEGTGPDAVLVVLVGTGHVAYGLGIERQLAARSGQTVASVVPLPVVDPEVDGPVTARASYADYLWGLPEEPPPAHPTLGLSLAPGSTTVRFVFPDSAASAAGFEAGDRLLAVDGVAVGEGFSLGRWVAGMSWGDGFVWTVEREGQPVEVRGVFRRSGPDGGAPL